MRGKFEVVLQPNAIQRQSRRLIFWKPRSQTPNLEDLRHHEDLRHQRSISCTGESNPSTLLLTPPQSRRNRRSLQLADGAIIPLL